MKPRKKNQVLTFMFSFVPGAAEMYMGFMKCGVSLMLLFLMPFMFTAILYSADYIATLSVVLYAIGFFHARNLANAEDEEFSAYEDKYIWEEYFDVKSASIKSSAYKKWIAIALIFIGGSGIWSIIRENVFRMLDAFPEAIRVMVRSVMNSVPELVFSILVIVGGIALIRGKKKELVEENNDTVENK